MAITPQQQELKEEEKQWADKLEAHFDEELASLGVAKKLIVSYEEWEFEQLSDGMRRRIKFEVAERYRKAGWLKVEWDRDPWNRNLERLTLTRDG